MNFRAAAYTTLQRAGGSRVGREYEAFLALERLDPLSYRAECERRLARVISHATTSVPYFRERVSRGASLADFPITTKAILSANHRDFMSDRLRDEVDRPHSRRPGYGWVQVQSGGTTGQPTTVIHDAAFRDAGRASRMYSQYLCGFPFGTKYTMLWGSMRDIRAQADSPAKRLLNALANFDVLNAFQLDPERLDSYLDHLRDTRARYLMAYVDAAEALALRALATNRKDVALVSVMACAGTVTATSRDRIRSAFGARTHNKYGSRECTDIACECEHGGIHIFAHHVHVEIVDDSGRPVGPGELGRILVTLLGNDAYPLVRYEIGDIGRAGKDVCPCGRPLPMLAQVEGRVLETLTTSSGSYVSPVYFRHLIGVVHNPHSIWRRFQIRQTSALDYTVLLERSAEVPIEVTVPELLQRIERDLRAVLGSDSRITCVLVDRIEEEASGKFLYAVNEMLRADSKGRASRV